MPCYLQFFYRLKFIKSLEVTHKKKIHSIIIIWLQKGGDVA